MSGRKDTRLTRAFPIVVSGPSGAGKTTLVDRLLPADPLLVESVSATTRPPRTGEVEGESYFFVSDADFESLMQGRLIEWAEVHGYRYGTPRDFVDGQLGRGRDVVLNVDVQGGKSVKRAFADALLIFILPPSLAVLEERIKGRATDQTGQIKKRLDNARGEIRHAADYDYIVINDELDETVRQMLSIIESERRRRGRYPENFIDRFIEGD